MITMRMVRFMLEVMAMKPSIFSLLVGIFYMMQKPEGDQVLNVYLFLTHWVHVYIFKVCPAPFIFTWEQNFKQPYV